MCETDHPRHIIKDLIIVWTTHNDTKLEMPLRTTVSECSTHAGYRGLLATYLCIHALLLIFDWYHPDAFLNGDRSSARLAYILAFLEAIDHGTDTAAVFASLPLPGDYALHAMAYGAAGRIGVILSQILIGMIGVAVLYKLAWLLTGSRKACAIATLTFILLPHSLAFPHLLVTETYANTAIILAFYFLTLSLATSGTRVSLLVSSAVFLCIATFIRPASLAFALVVFAILYAYRRVPLRTLAASYLAIAYLPIVAWIFFVGQQTGAYQLSSSGSTLPLNLYQKSQRITKHPTSFIAQSSESQPQTRVMHVGEYLQVITEYPRGFARIVKSDLANILLNSGANKLFGYYLGLYPIDKASRGAVWRNILDNQGFFAAIGFLLRQPNAYAVVNMLLSFVWAACLLAATAGAVVFARDERIATSLKWIFFSYICYVVTLTLIVVSYPRSGHRFTIEFLLCIFIAFALTHIHFRRTDTSPTVGDRHPSLR